MLPSHIEIDYSQLLANKILKTSNNPPFLGKPQINYSVITIMLGLRSSFITIIIFTKVQINNQCFAGATVVE